MASITPERLAEILRLHSMWLRGEEGGRRADLSGVDLRDADLSGVDLRGADLTDADLPHGFHIASLCFGGWSVTVTPSTTTIECQSHPNADWLRWSPADVAHMHRDAEKWWARHCEPVCAVIRDVMGLPSHVASIVRDRDRAVMALRSLRNDCGVIIFGEDAEAVEDLLARNPDADLRTAPNAADGNVTDTEVERLRAEIQRKDGYLVDQFEKQDTLRADLREALRLLGMAEAWPGTRDDIDRLFDKHKELLRAEERP